MAEPRDSDEVGKVEHLFEEDLADFEVYRHTLDHRCVGPLHLLDPVDKSSAVRSRDISERETNP